MKRLFERSTRGRVVFLQRVFLASIMGVMLDGCSRSTPAAPVPVPQEVAAVKVNDSKPIPPFTLEILDDLNDGSSLHVHGRITAATVWPSDDIMVRVSGVKSGEPVELASYPLLELLKPTGADSQKIALNLTAEKPVDFFVSVPASGLTDYQLELLWGREAKHSLPLENSHPQNVLPGVLTLTNMRIEKMTRGCPAAPCPSIYRISGTIFNGSAGVITEASLGVGYVWTPSGTSLDLHDQIPQDEETVHITGLKLAPQESRPFKLDLDKAVPEVSGGSYRPVVRIVPSNNP